VYQCLYPLVRGSAIPKNQSLRGSQRYIWAFGLQAQGALVRCPCGISKDNARPVNVIFFIGPQRSASRQTDFVCHGIKQSMLSIAQQRQEQKAGLSEALYIRLHSSVGTYSGKARADNPYEASRPSHCISLVRDG